MRGPLDGIVLDFDDTIFPTWRELFPVAARAAVVNMIRAGLQAEVEEAVDRLRVIRTSGIHSRWCAALAREYGSEDETIARAGDDTFYEYEIPDVRLDRRTTHALDRLQALAPLALLTAGHPPTQKVKVARVGIAGRFRELVYLDHRGRPTKTEALAGLLARTGWRPERVVVAGDRRGSDVRAGNRNGCLTVLVDMGGECSAEQAEGPDDEPWQTISHLAELPGILN